MGGRAGEDSTLRSTIRLVLLVVRGRFGAADGVTTSRAIGTRTAVTQEGVRVIAGVVAVPPGGRDRVAANEDDIHEPGLLVAEGRAAVEPAGHARLTSTERARAEPAKSHGVEDGLVPVRPAKLEATGRPIGVDGRRSGLADRRHGTDHVFDRTPSASNRCARSPAPTWFACNAAMLGRVSLQIDHVTKRFGATVALDQLVFDVPEGEVFGFLGANGAGKTTTMRICLGIVAPDAGEIRWKGRPVADLPRRTWGYLPEERGLYPRMSVLDQLVYYASLYGETPDRARREALGWLARFRIPEYAHRRAEELSKGNQQKVQFIAAILHAPEVLLMDEPFTGLDPINLVLLREAFMELRDRGRTLIFSTHQMEVAEAMCESVAIVDHGRLVAGGPLRDLKRASGRQWIRLVVDGPVPAPAWLEAIRGVDMVRRDATGAELELLPGIEPGSILADVLSRDVTISHFEVAEPSLEALFIELVGHPPDEETAVQAMQESASGPAPSSAPAGGPA